MESSIDPWIMESPGERFTALTVPVLVHHQRPDLNVVITPGSFSGWEISCWNLLEKAPDGQLSCVLIVVTTETVMWKPWSRHSGVARCTVAILIILISDAPSESVNHCHSAQGKYSTSSSAMAPEMLALEVTPRLLAGEEPSAHQFLCHSLIDGWSNGDKDSRGYYSNSGTVSGM